MRLDDTSNCIPGCAASAAGCSPVQPGSIATCTLLPLRCLWPSNKSRPRPTLRRGGQRATVQDHRTGRLGAFGQSAPPPALILRDGFKAAGAQPALRWLLDRVPGRQIVGHHPPRTTRAHKPPQRVEVIAQAALPLRRVRFHQGQIRCTERPFLVAYITGITLAGFGPPQLFTDSP